MRYFKAMKKLVSAVVLLMLVLTCLMADDGLIRNVEVSPSAILSDEEIDAIVAECLDSYSGIDILRAVVERINALYLEKGYPNAMAYIPEQTVRDGTAVVELVEGRIGSVTVEGNRYTKERFILKSLDLQSGEVLNLSALEDSLLTFNRWNSGIRLVGTLNPGKGESGTTDIDITVSETFPTGAYATFDNYASETTGGFRAGAHAVFNSLTGNRDILLTGIYMNLHSRTAYLDYSLPAFASGASDETRFGIKGSYGGSETESGPASGFGIRSVTANGSVYISRILGRSVLSNTSAVFSGGFAATTTYAMDTLLTKEIVVSGRAGIVSSKRLSDIVSLSFSAGITTGAPAKGASDLDDAYLKMDATFQTRITLPGAGYLLISATGQMMPFNSNIPNQEQMYIGGSNTVRGYSEGCAWGKDGLVTGIELHFLLPWSDRSTVFGFLDHGYVYPYTGDDNKVLVGTGGGIDIDIADIFHLKACVSFALTDIPQSSNPDGFKYSIAATVKTPNI